LPFGLTLSRRVPTVPCVPSPPGRRLVSAVPRSAETAGPANGNPSAGVDLFAGLQGKGGDADDPAGQAPSPRRPSGNRRKVGTQAVLGFGHADRDRDPRAAGQPLVWRRRARAPPLGEAPEPRAPSRTGLSLARARCRGRSTLTYLTSRASRRSHFAARIPVNTGQSHPERDDPQAASA
jgi:hypothetical protein